MLDYICGVTSHNKKGGGLKNLTKIALPRKSFVSTNGFKVEEHSNLFLNRVSVFWKGSRDKSFRAHGNNPVKVMVKRFFKDVMKGSNEVDQYIMK